MIVRFCWLRFVCSHVAKNNINWYSLVQLHKSSLSGDSDARMAVHLLQGAGRKQGNLGRYLFFEIGKQRDERQIIKQKVSAEICYGDLPWGRELWGRATYCYL